MADIIKVEAKYETAIETALGGNIQNIVTDDEETAKKMIGFLKKNKYGRATFLPLTSILHPQEFKTPEVLKEQGAIGMANELVKVEKKYENVAKAMLGRIVVIDNVDHAVKIAKKFDYGVRMVTLEGELLVPGGAISGGAFKNSSNLLGRRREMEQLKEQVAGHLKEIDVLLDAIEQTKAERNKIRKEIEEGKEQLQKRFIEQNTKRLNVMKAEEKKSEVGKGFEELKEEQNELESQAKELTEEKQAILNELKASEEMEKNIEKQIGEFQTALEEEREQESSQSAKVSELDMEAEKLIQKQEFEQENIDRILGEIGRYEGELAEINENLEKLLLEAEQKEANIEEIEKTIAASHTMKGESEEKLNQDIARKEELSGKQKNFLRKEKRWRSR